MKDWLPLTSLPLRSSCSTYHTSAPASWKLITGNMLDLENFTDFHFFFEILAERLALKYLPESNIYKVLGYFLLTQMFFLFVQLCTCPHWLHIAWRYKTKTWTKKRNYIILCYSAVSLRTIPLRVFWKNSHQHQNVNGNPINSPSLFLQPAVFSPTATLPGQAIRHLFGARLMHFHTPFAWCS